jgi:hypothetical protein
MNVKEAKVFLDKYLGVYLNENGYKKATPNGLSLYTKLTKDNYFSFSCYLSIYNEYQFHYSFGLGENKVIKVFNEINKKYNNLLYPKPIKGFMGIAPHFFVDIFDTGAGYKYFHDEVTLRERLDEVKNFYENEFDDYCAKFCSLMNLDNYFNSPANFCRYKRGLFPTLGFFHVTRLIIAKLSGQYNFEEIVERNFLDIESFWKEDGLVYDRNDFNNPEVCTVDYLRKMV